ncbi:RagB/SusD family nutrient uptake outer membrane protein [Porphyromonas sp.]|uniref:RagB/SusD family nutrient uptake outer membrane protein n=1 Tax=Porphyromonas sp. TaxID=1924944 RepID=UPI0026DCB219|nr:RagB/SusD family nutrient uptake outer membrane protein [Porphyromonas sp.]MDO4770442.1 RagB/SusD family nutrient uptake outer membrane protein [Porphyromonas sp.]
MKYILSTILVALCVSSCSDWLDVEPKTNVREERLFSDEQGFKEALTGAYILTSKPPLYGKELTYGFIDQLAQRYVNPVNVDLIFDFTKPTFYNFELTALQTKNYTNAIWSESYNIIANINNLIENIEKRGDRVTTPGLRDIIHGEALGLRAFLHFDLLRMFGPTYKSNFSDTSIPYRTQFNRDTKALLPATEIVELVLSDLKKAEALLENDPMDISYESPSNGATNNPFLHRRSKRMNKFAVKALMARVYLYKGDMAEAKNKANEVINAENKSGNRIFEFVTDNAKDHLLSKELIFAISMDKTDFATRIRGDFDGSQFSYCNAGDRARLNEIFDVKNDGVNDIRMREAGGFSVTTTTTTTQKYRQDNSHESINNTIPLIRLAEMYYIVAEATADLSESARVLSQVRKARALESLQAFRDEDEKLKNIEKEYRKEFYAEGQLWHFYKRKEYKTFLFSPIKEMNEKHYRFSVPENEITFGNL